MRSMYNVTCPVNMSAMALDSKLTDEPFLMTFYDIESVFVNLQIRVYFLTNAYNFEDQFVYSLI